MKRFRLVSMLGDPTPAVGSFVTPAMLNGSKSMRRRLGLLLFVLALPASAADRAEEVRATEIDRSRNLLIRQGERNDGVFRAMIGPKQFAVESQ